MKYSLKRMLCIILSLIVVTTCCVTVLAGTTQVCILGDVQNNGEVSVMDATHLQLYLAGINKFDTLIKYLADVDGNSVVAIRDATYLQLYVAKIQITYPVNADGYSVGDMITFENGQVVKPTESTSDSTTLSTVVPTAPLTTPTVEETTQPMTEPTTETEPTTPPALPGVPAETISVNSTVAYTLKGLKYARAVQNFYIASKYLYVTQRIGSTTYLSRLLMDPETKTATYMDHMTFLNAGHGQSLDMYTYNDINYLYIGCKPETYSGGEYYFSLQAARIIYQAGKKYDYTDLNRFSYMNYANPTATRLGTTYRVAVGGNSRYTIFRIQTEEGTVTYSIYDTAKINALLDESQSVRMDSAEAQAACVNSFTQQGSAIIRPNGSFQGIDMLDNDRIFLTGGADGEVPMMACMSNSGSYDKLIKIVDADNKEIEGVQCKNGNLYFLIVADTSDKANTQQIRYIPDSLAE